VVKLFKLFKCDEDCPLSLPVIEQLQYYKQIMGHYCKKQQLKMQK
jgi:hypothetical protein